MKSGWVRVILLGILTASLVSAVIWRTMKSSDAQTTDLDDELITTIRKLPGVTDVTRHGTEKNAEIRLIHLVDWHFVPEDLFEKDVQHQAGGRLSKTEVRELFQEHLKDVDSLQREQMQLLRSLIRDEKLRTVFVEGVTETSILLLEARVAAFGN